MYTRTARLSLVLILGLVASASWGADKTFDQHFTAPPGGRLVVDTDVGAITISGHDSRDLTVHVDISGSNADNIKFSAAQTASGVTVIGRSSDSSWFHLGSNWNRVKIMIEAPRDYPVELKTAGGGLDVRGINAEVQGSTSGGGIDLHDIAGPIDLRTSGGGIDAHNLKGSVRLRSSGVPSRSAMSPAIWTCTPQAVASILTISTAGSMPTRQAVACAWLRCRTTG